LGQTYQSQSPVADCEDCINWYAESIEGSGKSPFALYPTPGLSLFCALPTGPVRGIYYLQYSGGPTQGRTFAVGGNTLYEVFSNGTSTALGNVGNDGKLVSMCASPLQLAVASNGILFVYTFATTTFPITPASFQFVPPNNFPLGPIAKVAYGDGFFIVFSKNTNYWQVSTPYNALSWPPLAIAQVSVFPENIISLIVDHRYVWIFGQKKSQVYVDAGTAIFPYQVIPGALIEQGSIALNSTAQVDNSIFLLGGDERGAGMVWRTSGYSLVRVSTHAVETAIQGYLNKGTKIDDAIGYGYQDQGHTFYVLYFPTANATWVYDVATSLWHKRAFFTNGNYIAHLSQCHAHAFKQHLVGDWNSGNIYNMSILNLTDNGSAIRRVRIAPTISTESQWIFYRSLQIDVETGLGPQPPLTDGNGDPRAPQIQLTWSKDNGHTWSSGAIINCGMAGQYKTRAIIRRLGRARNMTFQVVATDPIAWRLVDAYLDATGFQPSERIVKQLTKVA
jgi:hypothetical protein